MCPRWYRPPGDSPGAPPRQPRGRALEPERFVFEEPRQPFAAGGSERTQAQLLADAVLMV